MGSSFYRRKALGRKMGLGTPLAKRGWGPASPLEKQEVGMATESAMNKEEVTLRPSVHATWHTRSKGVKGMPIQPARSSGRSWEGDDRGQETTVSLVLVFGLRHWRKGGPARPPEQTYEQTKSYSQQMTILNQEGRTAMQEDNQPAEVNPTDCRNPNEISR